MTTTNTQRLDATPQILQTYTLLQIASEAFLNGTSPTTEAAPPTGSLQFNIFDKWLTDGNGHSSRMTTKQAKQFSEEWRVASHQSELAPENRIPC